MRMGRESSAGFTGALPVAPVAFAALLAVLLFAPDASAQAPSSVELLKSVGCPVRYDAVDQKDSYSGQEVADAMAGNYQVDSYFPAVNLTPPINWTQDPFQSKHWRDALNSFKWLDPLLWEYSSAGPLALPALAKARDIALDWADAASRPERGLNKEAWFDKTVGDRTPYMAFIARASACEGLLNDDQAAQLIGFMQLQGDRLRSNKRYSPSNRGLFEDFGLYLLSQYMPFLKDASGWAKIAPPRMADTFHGRLNEREGTWLEHSPGYQVLVVKTIQKFVGITGKDAFLLKRIPRMQDAVGWLMLPDQTMPQFGDTYRDRVPDWGVDHAAGKQGMHVFRKTGYAVVKEGENYFATTDQFHNTDHVSADQLTFELYDGRRVITDTGLYDKDIGRYRRFERSAAAHSVLTVDGQEPKLKPRAAFGGGLTASGTGDGWYAVEGVDPLLRRQRVHERRLFLYKPGTGLIIIDRVRAKTRHRYTRYFHFGPDIDIAEGKNGLHLNDPAPTGILQAQGKLSAARGQDNPLQGFQFPSFRTRLPRWSVAYTTHGRNADYVSTVSLNPDQPLTAKLRGRVGKRTHLSLRSGGKPVGGLLISRGRRIHIKKTR
jgi:Heparinase II/III-like protein/Heparinase II/III N-terminus